jgi:hypothetical protein
VEITPTEGEEGEEEGEKEKEEKGKKGGIKGKEQFKLKKGWEEE